MSERRDGTIAQTTGVNARSNLFVVVGIRPHGVWFEMFLQSSPLGICLRLYGVLFQWLMVGGVRPRFIPHLRQAGEKQP